MSLCTKKIKVIEGFILISLTLLIMFTTIVTAANSEYQKTFNKIGTYGKIDIQDKNENKVIEYTLNKNSEQCLINCYSEGTAKLYKQTILFSNIDFFNKHNSKKNYPYKVYIEKTDYVMSKINDTTYIKEYYNYWSPYNNEELKPGVYNWRMETSKDILDSIDWIANYEGVSLNNWAWYNSTWTKKAPITIREQSGTNLLNYSVKVVIPYNSFMLSNFSDLRFINSSENGELNYWIESKTDGVTATVWILLPQLTASSNNTIYMYYNNSLATGTTGNIKTAFLFGDDFNDGSIDLTLWTKTGTVTEAGGSATFNIQFVGNNYAELKSSVTISNNTEFVYNLAGYLTTNGVTSADIYAGYSNFDSSTMNLSSNYLLSRKNYDALSDYFQSSTSIANSTNFGSGYSNSGTRVIKIQRNSQGKEINASSNTYYSLSSVTSGSVKVGASTKARGGGAATMDSLVLDYVYLRNLSSTDPLTTLGISQQIFATISLTSPENNKNDAVDNYIFSASYSSDNFTFVNTTLYLWNSSGGLVNTNYSVITGTTNTSSLRLDLESYDNYTWNYYACIQNSTFNRCIFSMSNYTLTYSKIIKNSESYNPTTIEGTTELFTLNLTISESETLTSAYLIYNNTQYPVSVSQSGNYYTFTKSLDIQTISTDTIFNFYWSINLNSGQYNTSTNTQSVSNINADNCNAFSRRIFNLTMYDETSLSVLLNTTNPKMEYQLIIYDSERTSEVVNYFNISRNNKTSLCVNLNNINSTAYSVDLLVKYSADGYATEYYNIQDMNFSNSTATQLINLYDLDSANSTSFKVTVRGSDALALSNALIYVQREYISNGNFLTVELPKTDTTGQTILHLVRNDIKYNLLVVKDGEVKIAYYNIQAFCDDYTIGNCQIFLNANLSTSDLYNYSSDIDLIFTNPVYDDSTKLVSFVFQIIDNTAKNVTMIVSKKDAFGNDTSCNAMGTFTSATLSCNIGSVTDGLLQVDIYVEGVKKLTYYIQIPDEGFGIMGYLALFMFALSVILLFSGSKVGVLFGVILGFVGGVSLGMLKGTMIGLGSAGIWLLIIVGIAFYKLKSDREDTG